MTHLLLLLLLHRRRRRLLLLTLPLRLLTRLGPILLRMRWPAVGVAVVAGVVAVVVAATRTPVVQILRRLLLLLHCRHLRWKTN